MSNETNSVEQTIQYFRDNIVNSTDMVPTNESVLKIMNNSFDKQPGVKTQLALYDIIIPTIGAVIILLNLAVVISSGLILKKGQQPRSTYLFLGNVAMTDLITGMAVVFGQVYPKENRDHYICALQLGMIVSSTLASVYSVGLIAIDRFLYILHGIHYQQWVYPTRARLMIVGTWVIGCIIGFLPMFGWYGNTDNGRVCWFIFLAPRSLIVLTVISGAIPVLVVISLYSIILYHAINKILQLQNSKNTVGGDENNPTKNLRMFRGRGNLSATPAVDTPDSQDSVNKAKKTSIFAKIFKKKPSKSVKSPSKWKAIKVVLFTSGSFVITWSPYFITCLIYVYQCENNIENKISRRCKNIQIIIASPLAILGFTNSLINPIIYAWWHKGFRTYVQKRVSVVIMKTRRSIIAIENFRSNYSHSNSQPTASDANKTSETTNNSTSGNDNNVSVDPINTRV